MTVAQKDLNEFSEPKAQRWRAIAEIVTTEPHNAALLCLGSSITQIRENYESAFSEVLADEIKKKVRRIFVERFDGAPDCGHWVNQGHLTVPKPVLRK